jgi:hypothetical protein
VAQQPSAALTGSPAVVPGSDVSSHSTGKGGAWVEGRWGFVAYCVGTVVIGVALAVAALLLMTPSLPDPAAPWQTSLALGIAGILLALIAFGAGAANRITYLPALWAIAPLIPALAAIFVVAAYLVAPPGRGAAALILGAEIAAALAVLGAIPLRMLATIRVAQTRSYWELRRRSEQLRARLTIVQKSPAPMSKGDIRPRWTTSQKMALAEADGQLCEVERALWREPDEMQTTGLEWVSAMGYVSLWRRVDRAEEALIDVEPRWLLIADALHDRLRLRDAGVKSDQLEYALSAAAKVIDADAYKRYFAPPTIAVHGSHYQRIDTGGRSDPSQSAAAASALDGSLISPTDLPGARAILREVRNSMNVYFEDAMEGIVRARNRLWRAILLTSSTTFLMVGLAVLSNVPRSQLVAASVFFLVAAIVGLFNRLRLQAKADSAIEDFNLFEARLMHTPLVSGLAGLAGVILVAIAPAASGQNVTSLSNVLDLASNPAGLLLAAGFGLTPDRIIGTLEDQTEKLKGQLKAGKAAVLSTGTPSGDDTGTV